MDKRKERYSQLLADINTKSNQVNGLFDAADKRGDGVNTQAEIDEIKKLNQEIEGLNTQAEELKGLLGIKEQNSTRLTDLNKPERIAFHGGPSNADNPSALQFKSLGDAVLGDEQMSAWLKQICPEGVAPTGNIPNSPKITVKNFLPLNGQLRTLEALKTLITGASDTSAGALVFPDFKPIVDESYKRPLNIRDVITIGQTGSDQVEYVRIGTPTNAAAPTAEATAVSGSSGTKPESALPFSRVSETVKTIPHWVPVTNRALADVPQLRTYIDSFLRYGIEEELEDQIVTGNGTGENFTGILNVAGISTQAFDTNILTTSRKARTKVRTLGRAVPTAWVMHPTDWETFDLSFDNEQRYYFGGPLVMGTPRLWGLPVVESEAITTGTTVVADWKLAILWDRMQTMISMSNSHSDFFVRNMVAILAEFRAAFGVVRPAAFVSTDLTA